MKIQIIGSNWLGDTLVYQIDVWDEISMHVGKFLENIKRADQNKAVQARWPRIVREQ